MDALDKLLVMCHAQALNLFVESYLKMVQKLLECNETDLQCLATSSVSASNILIQMQLFTCLVVCQKPVKKHKLFFQVF